MYIFIHQLHIEIEDRLFGIGGILTVYRSQFILRINQFAPIEIIADIRNHLIIQTIGKQSYISVFHAHIIPQSSYLLISTII